MSKPPNYWTAERIASEAAKHETRKEFAEKAAGAYCAAIKLGFLDDVCGHMVNSLVHDSKWNRKIIKGLVSNCKTLKEFRTKHRGAYKAVLKYGWQDELESLSRSSRPPGYWTKQRIKDEAAKYSTRTAFMKGAQAAYNKAIRLGIIDEVCGHMKYVTKPMRYWTPERIFNAAGEYDSRSAFMEGAAGAYSAATKLGILDEACAHMRVKGSRYKRAIYAFEFDNKSVYVGLTFDYDTRYREHLTQGGVVAKQLEKHDATFIEYGEWYELEEAAAAEIAAVEDYRKRGWKLLNRMKAGGVGSYPRKWTFESCLELASQYRTVKEFIRDHQSAYTVAHRKGWWPTISKHMIRATEHGKWTEKALALEAQKYSTRRDLEKGSGGAYSAARKKGLLDQVCAHMKRQVNPVGYWTKERVLQEARKYQTRVAFQRGSSAAYQKAWKMGLIDVVCAHMEDLRMPAGYWTLERINKLAKTFNTRSEFMQQASAAYQFAHKKGWLDEVCNHMIFLRHPKGYWTRKRILDVARKFKTVKEFRDASGGAYDAAYEQGLMPIIQKELKMDKKPNGYWTLERVSEEAKNYSSRSEFMKACSSAYGKALKMGWLDKVCSHM